jgi:hypothetical protein
VEPAVEASAATPAVHVHALALRGCVRAHLGDHARAVEDVRVSMKRFADNGGIEENEAAVRMYWAEALMAAGQRDEALDAIRSARDRILERAARIEDEASRRSFMTRERFKARTLEIAAQWLDR